MVDKNINEYCPHCKYTLKGVNQNNNKKHLLIFLVSILIIILALVVWLVLDGNENINNNNHNLEEHSSKNQNNSYNNNNNTSTNKEAINVYFFLKNDDYDSEQINNILTSIDEKYENYYNVKKYNIDGGYQHIFNKVKDYYNLDLDVPLVFVGKKYFSGYNNSYKEAITQAIIEEYNKDMVGRVDIITLALNNNNSDDYDVSMFNELSIANFKDLFNKPKDEIYFIYTGRETCSHCLEFLPNLQKSILDYDYDLYYLDMDNVNMSITKEIREFDSKLNNFGATPIVYVIQKGKVIDYSLGYKSYDNYSKFLERNNIKRR